ncbi:MAG: RHS repeat domain-containing protein [Prosthecobacter sp.]
MTKDLRFVYDGWQMIAELDHTFAAGTGLAGSAANRTFLWGLDLSGSMTGAGGVGGLLSTTYQGITYQACSDANGNVTGLVPVSGTGAGTLVARFDYDPFGNRVTNAGPSVELCPFGFSSKHEDKETNFIHFDLRDYQPLLGRWASADIVGEKGGVNLYGICLNNPVCLFDPDGRMPEIPGHGHMYSPYTSIEKVRETQDEFDREYDLNSGSDVYKINRNFRRLYRIAEEIGPNMGNMFVFTCKYGWIDMAHFFNSATATYLSSLVTPVWMGGYVIERVQEVVDQSSWFAPEDLTSNRLGIDFGERALKHDNFAIDNYLQSSGTPIWGANKVPRAPIHKNVLVHMAASWKDFLKKAGAVAWDDPSTHLWDGMDVKIKRMLMADIEEYKKNKVRAYSWAEAAAWRKGRKVFGCLCNGSQPQSKYRMRR